MFLLTIYLLSSLIENDIGDENDYDETDDEFQKKQTTDQTINIDKRFYPIEDNIESESESDYTSDSEFDERLFPDSQVMFSLNLY